MVNERQKNETYAVEVLINNKPSSQFLLTSDMRLNACAFLTFFSLFNEQSGTIVCVHLYGYLLVSCQELISTWVQVEVTTQVTSLEGRRRSFS